MTKFELLATSTTSGFCSYAG